mmetsp:Transcript_31816/g.74609  ORF Transcript_31816/g.74609 Transcript_31816/m.74609 type:complete len:118 (+) Transcript_31816:83-436(+)
MWSGVVWCGDGTCQVCGRSDVWSLAASALHLVTGAVPWTGGQSKPMATILYNILESKGGPPWDRKALSPMMNHFLDCCFHAEPRERPTAQECMSHPWFGDVVRNEATSEGEVPSPIS